MALAGLAVLLALAYGTQHSKLVGLRTELARRTVDEVNGRYIMGEVVDGDK